MIDSIKIQNYKLFKSFEIEDLSHIVLISGKNNCGKTTVLEALFMALDCSSPGMFIKSLAWRGLNSVYNNAESLFAPSFYNFNLDEAITFDYSINSSKKKLSYKFQSSLEQPLIVKKGNRIEFQKKLDKSLGGVEIVYGTGTSKFKAFLNLDSKGLFLTDTKGISLTNTKALLNYNQGVRAVFLASSQFVNSQENSQRFGELDRLNKTDEILNKLQILEPQLKALSLIPMGGTPIIHGDKGIGKKIPLALMGQGILRLLSLLLAISECKNGIVLIDEMENGFHHSVLPLVWKAIANYAKENKTQIIATTHSCEFISGAVRGLPNNMEDHFSYMRIEKDNNEFKTKKYSFEDLNLALDAELEIR